MGKSRIVDGPAPPPHAPDRVTPAGDVPGACRHFSCRILSLAGPWLFHAEQHLSSSTTSAPYTGATDLVQALDLARARPMLARAVGYDAVENISSAFGNYIDDAQWQNLGNLFTPSGARKEPAVGSFVGPDHISRAERSSTDPTHARYAARVDLDAYAHPASDRRFRRRTHCKIAYRLFQLGASANRPGFFTTGGMYEDSAARADGYGN